MISSDRLRELMSIYSELKERINAIDRKYNLEYTEPTLDMPPTLGLNKMTFIPKTEEEINGEAEVKCLPFYTAKKNVIENNFRKTILNFDNKYAKVSEAYRNANLKLIDEYVEICDGLYRRLAANNLLFSSVKEKAQKHELDEYKKRLDKATSDYETRRGYVELEEEIVRDAYKKSNEALKEEKQAKIRYYTEAIKKEELKRKESIDKYNAQIDEKEVKYQASREKAYENARQAEYDRVYKMTKLYAEIGEAGISRTKINEKMAVCKQYFSPLTREEAQALLSYDSFLRGHLQTYYNTFVDWVNSNLA